MTDPVSSKGWTGSCERSKIFTPSSSSSFWIIMLNVGCVTKEASAAFEKWR